jgi:hypothetical protein
MTDTPEKSTAESIHYCPMHPTVEATLRCNKCERYMCTECAVITPVGYRCKECVRAIDDSFFTATQIDHVTAVVMAGVLGAVLAIFNRLLGYSFGVMAIFIGAAFGYGLVAFVTYMTEKRRGRYFAEMSIAACVGCGFIMASLIRFGFNISLWMFLAGACGAIYLRYKGKSIRFWEGR